MLYDNYKEYLTRYTEVELSAHKVNYEAKCPGHLATQATILDCLTSPYDSWSKSGTLAGEDVYVWVVGGEFYELE